MRGRHRKRKRPILFWLGVVPLLLAALAVGSLAFSGGKAGTRQGDEGVGKKTIEQVLREHTPELLSVTGVVGTAEGRYEGRPCIEVYVVKETPALRKRIPTSLDGYPVTMKETGTIRSLPEKPTEPSTEK
jgi:hypothetical protein